MNLSKIPKIIGAGVMVASLAIVPLTLPAHAQNNAPSTSQRSGNVDATGSTSTADYTNRDRTDWGWFGLLGLIGLAGLAGRNRRETIHHSNRDPDVTVRPGNDYR